MQTENEETSEIVDQVRRKLLKIGIYTAPTIALLGKVRGAKASGANYQNRRDIAKEKVPDNVNLPF